MERTLVILRHAKAVHAEGLADVDRPLIPRGHADAAAAGAWLAQRGLHPDLVLCSVARRTRETLSDVAEALGNPAVGPPPVRYEDAIYLGSPGALLSLVRTIPATAGTALLIGHNPGVTLLSVLLDPDGDIGGNLRTSGIAVHTFDGDWVDWGPRVAALTTTGTPRG